MRKQAFETVKDALTDGHFTLEEAWKLKNLIDKLTDYPITDEKVVIFGVQVIQSTSIPVQKMFVHPFTLGRILSDPYGPIDIITGTGADPDPLTPEEQEILDTIEKVGTQTDNG